MAFWWVNHSQTVRVERDGGYIWSPETNKDGSRNEAYLNLKRIKPLDIIFSWADGRIGAVGVVQEEYKTSKRPLHRAYKANDWSNEGWRVPIDWITIQTALYTKAHFDDLKPFLPEKYSPLKSNGDGQLRYLSKISDDLGNLILALVESTNPSTNANLIAVQKEIEGEIVQETLGIAPISKTEREQIILARIGQGLFRREVEKIENACRWTGVRDKRFLLASHIKPWKNSTNEERLDGHNGFLLSPHVDRLFDKGYVTFNEDGKILTSSNEVLNVLQYWGLGSKKTVGHFTERQQEYLHYHRANIFKQQLSSQISIQQLIFI
jgi:putative restriction endonuclease